MLLYAKGLQFDGLPTNFFFNVVGNPHNHTLCEKIQKELKNTGLSEKFDLMLFDFFIFVCGNPQATVWIFMQLYFRLHEVHS